MVPQDKRDFRSDRYNNNRPRKDFTRHFGSTTTKIVSTVFQEPVHQILKKFKNEPTFNGQTRWEETPRSATKVLPIGHYGVI